MMEIRKCSASGRQVSGRTAGTIPCVFLVLFSLGTFCYRVVAQQAEPDSYAGFEGKKVGRVEISAKPTADTEAFRPLIAQKEGEPFSMAAIKDSVAALQKTK